MCGSEGKPGLIQLFLSALFVEIANKKDFSYRVRISYFEVYNETINDLVNPENKNLDLRETSTKAPVIQGLEEVAIQNATEALHILQLGNKARQTAETNMNNRSSRSHAIFKVMIESRSNKFSNKSFFATLMLADLAGSEGLKPKSKGVNMTPNINKRKAEGSAINKSLLALYNVILKLSKGESCPTFRESKLTRILQPVLSGNSRTAIVCTVNPVEAQISESCNTLRFGIFASNILTKVKMNEIASLEVSGPEANQRKEEMEKLIEKNKEFEEENEVNKGKMEEIRKMAEETNEENERLKGDLKVERIKNEINEGKIASLENQIKNQKKIVSDLESLLKQFELFGTSKNDERLFEAQCEKLTLENDYLKKQMWLLEGKNGHLEKEIKELQFKLGEGTGTTSHFIEKSPKKMEGKSRINKVNEGGNESMSQSEGFEVMSSQESKMTSSEFIEKKEMDESKHFHSECASNSGLIIEKEGPLSSFEISDVVKTTSSQRIKLLSHHLPQNNQFSVQCGRLLKQMDSMKLENAKMAKKIIDLEAENSELKGAIELSKRSEGLSAMDGSSSNKKKVNRFDHVTKKIQTSPGKDELKRKIQRFELKNRKLEEELERQSRKYFQSNSFSFPLFNFSLRGQNSAKNHQ